MHIFISAKLLWKRLKSMFCVPNIEHSQLLDDQDSIYNPDDPCLINDHPWISPSIFDYNRPTKIYYPMENILRRQDDPIDSLLDD